MKKDQSRKELKRELQKILPLFNSRYSDDTIKRADTVIKVFACFTNPVLIITLMILTEHQNINLRGGVFYERENIYMVFFRKNSDTEKGIKICQFEQRMVF